MNIVTAKQALNMTWKSTISQITVGKSQSAQFVTIEKMVENVHTETVHKELKHFYCYSSNSKFDKKCHEGKKTVNMKKK